MGGAAVVGDLELDGGGGGVGSGGCFEDAAALGEVEFIAAGAGVTAGFGMAAGAEEGNAEGDEAIAEAGRFAGGEDEADVREEEAESTDQLDELAVAEVGERLEFAGAGAESGQGDGQLSFPAGAEEVEGVGGDAEGLEAPVGESVEGADAEAAESGGVGAFGGFEAPVEVPLGAGGMHFGVDVAVVGFLVDDEAIGAGLGQGAVGFGFERADFEGDGGDGVVDSADGLGEVIAGDEAGVFTGDEEDIAEALALEGVGFAEDLLEGKGDPEDGVITGEAAVAAIVDALVGEVKGGEEADDSAEALSGEGLGFPAEGFEQLAAGGGEEAGEVGQAGVGLGEAGLDGGGGGAVGFAEEAGEGEAIELGHEAHGGER